MAAEIGAAAVRDVARWPGLVGGNTPESGSYAGEVAAMSRWLTGDGAGTDGRTQWIDGQMPAPPEADVPDGLVDPGTVVTLTGTGAIDYDLDGRDPRPAGGSSVGVGVRYRQPIRIDRTTVLVARRQDVWSTLPGSVPIFWSAPLVRVYLVGERFAGPGDLEVLRLDDRPDDSSDAERAAAPGVVADDFEFLEIVNAGTEVVNTFGSSLDGAGPLSTLRLGARTLAPGDRVFIVRKPAAFRARSGSEPAERIAGTWDDGSLSRRRGVLRLIARDGAVISEAPEPASAR
jgi:hypothetical protein